MKLLITGATGFLGPYVVAAALRRGHAVKVVVRPASREPGGSPFDHASVSFVRADLRSRSGLEEAVAGVDAVVHMAAAKSGSYHDQFSGTVLATENLLGAMRAQGVDRMVLISSFAVYDYTAMRRGAMVDEESPIEDQPESRDDYCRTKLLQERLVREALKDGWLRAAILRPGVIYGGQDNLFSARVGVQLSPTRWLRTGAGAVLPLTYVENCAEAIVLAAESEAALGQTCNVVDDDLRSQKAYVKALRARMDPRPAVIPVNYTLLWWMACLGQKVNDFLFGGRMKVPSLFRPAALAARCRPLRYCNVRARQVLGWTPRFGVDEAMDRSLHPPADLFAVPASRELEATCASPT